MRESAIEAHLVRRVQEAGGEIRKASWIGRRGCPDRVIFYQGNTHWVELKREGGKLSGHQMREHARMEKQGVDVHVLYNKNDVEDFICRLTRG